MWSVIPALYAYFCEMDCCATAFLFIILCLGENDCGYDISHKSYAAAAGKYDRTYSYHVYINIEISCYSVAHAADDPALTNFV